VISGSNAHDQTEIELSTGKIRETTETAGNGIG
jgi:hypothetical protein